MMVLRVEPDLVRTAAKRPASAEPPTILEKRLEQLIEEQQIFMTEGLTIGGLAERLGEQEYKVRQLINARLGFRNFVAFLNHYRIREARKVLADPGQKHLGVAEIAFRHGYSSLGPFNRAFKEIVGQTPTEYRKAALSRKSLPIPKPARLRRSEARSLQPSDPTFRVGGDEWTSVPSSVRGGRP